MGHQALASMVEVMGQTLSEAGTRSSQYTNGGASEHPTWTGRGPDKEERMRKQRVAMSWSAGSLASGVLAATVLAQAPMPPSGPVPVQPTGPAPRVVCEPEGG